MSATTETYRFITVEHRGAVTVLTINRPDKLNAIDRATLTEVAAAVDAFVADAAQGALIVTGSGTKAFISGADIGELQPLGPAAAEDISRFGQDVVARFERSPKPTIAAINGYAFGGGCELALACHVRLASDNAVMGLPEVKLGIIPGYGGTQRLPRLIGVERALPLLRTGRTIGAKEACAWGWATGEPATDALAAAKALVRRAVAGEVKLAPVSPEPMPKAALDAWPKVDIGHRSLAIDAILVDVVKRGLSLPLAEGLVLEAEGFARCRNTVDMDIGMKNFVQNGPRVPAAFLHE